MQVIVDGARSFGEIVQVAPTRDELVVNGKYVIESPTGVEIAVTGDSYAHPIDGGDVKSLMMAELLASSGLTYLYFNPLSSLGDSAVIDLATIAQVGVFPNIKEYQTRCQISEVPNNTKILKAFDQTLFDRSVERQDGALLTTAIDISANVPLGTQVFLPYWEAHTFAISHEVEDENLPIIKTYQKLSPSALQVYVSTDGGAFWQEVRHLEAFNAPAPSTDVRFLFINTSTAQDVYLNAFGFMY